MIVGQVLGAQHLPGLSSPSPLARHWSQVLRRECPSHLHPHLHQLRKKPCQLWKALSCPIPVTGEGRWEAKPGLDGSVVLFSLFAEDIRGRFKNRSAMKRVRQGASSSAAVTRCHSEFSWSWAKRNPLNIWPGPVSANCSWWLSRRMQGMGFSPREAQAFPSTSQCSPLCLQKLLAAGIMAPPSCVLL